MNYPRLSDCSLDQLHARMWELDQFALAQEQEEANVEQLRADIFILGFDPDQDWNNYHLVRNEYDRRAAEEFDLGQ